MITSPQNEKLKLVRKLISNRRHRERDGLFVAEGEDLVASGLTSGQSPLFLLKAAADDVALPGEHLDPAAFEPPIEVKRKVLAGVSSLGSGCRILGVWPEAWAEPEPGSVCVYLDGVSDPGNVGAIIRTSHALSRGTVVLGPGCADPFGPKAVRASMGSVFFRPPARTALERLPRPLLGLAAHGGRWPLESALAKAGMQGVPGAGHDARAAARPSLTLCLGSERQGLSPDLAAACDELVTIPLPGGAESLNVAASAAICLERVSSLAVLATGSDLNSPNEGTDA